MLSYCAKFGIEWTDPISHLKSVIYSRDSLALPLQKMANMLRAIRDGSFQPDKTRSGRFVEVEGSRYAGSSRSWNLVGEGTGQTASEVISAEVSDAAPIVVSEDEDVKLESGIVPPLRS